MHAHPHLHITPPSLLTIVSPDYDHPDTAAISYNHILSLAQAVKEEEQLAVPGLHNVDRDSLNTTPDMYEHASAHSYLPHHFHPLNPPLSPLASGAAAAAAAAAHLATAATNYDGRMPSLSPSPIDEQPPQHVAFAFTQPPMAQPRSAPHNQLHFTNPFAPDGSLLHTPGGALGGGYGFPADRRSSEPAALLSHSSALVDAAPVFLAASARHSLGARTKDMRASPAPSSSSNSGAPWTPPPTLAGADHEVRVHEPPAALAGRALPLGASSAGLAAPTKAEAGSPSLGNAPHPGPHEAHGPQTTTASGYEQSHRTPYLRAEGHGPSSSANAPSQSVPRSHPGADAALVAHDAGREHPSSPDQSSSKTYSFVPLPGNAVKKRPRRRYDEIERLYRCSFVSSAGEECAKAYGTLNHLNAHIQMQRHGEKRSPTEFKELRKQWRKAKKDAELIQGTMPPSHDPHMSPGMSAMGGRAPRPHLGVRIPSGYGPDLSSPSHHAPSPLAPPPFVYSLDTAPGGTPPAYAQGGGGGGGYHHPLMSPPAGPSPFALPSLSMRMPGEPRGAPAHDERLGYGWPSAAPQQEGRYERRPSLPTPRPGLSHRASWASTEYEYDTPTHEQPPLAQGGGASSFFAPPTPFEYSPDSAYPPAGATFLPQQPTLQEVPPTAEELERFPPTNTLLTPLPGYVPPVDLGSLEHAPSGYAGRGPHGANTMLAPIPSLMHGSWRHDEPQHNTGYHEDRNH